VQPRLPARCRPEAGWGGSANARRARDPCYSWAAAAACVTAARAAGDHRCSASCRSSRGTRALTLTRARRTPRARPRAPPRPGCVPRRSSACRHGAPPFPCPEAGPDATGGGGEKRASPKNLSQFAGWFTRVRAGTLRLAWGPRWRGGFGACRGHGRRGRGGRVCRRGERGLECGGARRGTRGWGRGVRRRGGCARALRRGAGSLTPRVRRATPAGRQSGRLIKGAKVAD